MMYLPGITFLFIVSMIIAIPFAMLVKRKSLAVILSASVSTLLLKLWAFFSMDGFDLTFLVMLIIISLCAALAVRFVMDGIRKRLVRGLQNS